jgi:hypothetical protein
MELIVSQLQGLCNSLIVIQEVITYRVRAK